MLPSDHVYTISFPFSYLGRFSTVADHPLPALSVTVVPFDSVTVRLAGRAPALLLLSFQTFLTVTSVISGLCTLVSVVTVPFTLVLFSS